MCSARASRLISALGIGPSLSSDRSQSAASSASLRSSSLSRSLSSWSALTLVSPSQLIRAGPWSLSSHAGAPQVLHSRW
jgi:hypothetical protein